MYVGTIHEFLWKLIAPFQRELRAEMLVINEAAKKPIEGLAESIEGQQVTYGQHGRHFDRGELSHDDVIATATALFKKYPKITRIAAHQYPFIFVDEYQDTHLNVVSLLMEHFAKSPSKPVVGFFGDSMQQIYDSKVRDVATTHGLRAITKLENYRCSVAVIDVLNRLRTDIQQVPGGENRPGHTRLFTSDSGQASVYKLAMSQLDNDGWSYENTKILMLTHKGIAREVGFTGLIEAYGKRSFGNDTLMARDDEFGAFFTYISTLVSTYEAKRYGAFLDMLGKSGFRLESKAQKMEIATEIQQLQKLLASADVSSIVEFVSASALIPLPQKIARLRSKMSPDPSEDDSSQAKKRVFYEAVMGVPWSEVTRFVEYVEEFTPFSTKHAVKGAEFENVLVIIDDSLWNMYKFGEVFTEDESNAARLERSRKLLYVCFSRAMNGLAVLTIGQPASAELNGLRQLLGVDHVMSLTV
ncbi:hypothetical protein BO218_00425 [Microbacterium paludicola]|nr:hypothetical protein BO218_00425 [Microbacterium paludicola]